MMRFHPAIFCLLAAPATAQPLSGADVTIAAAHNQLGLLEYCATQGHPVPGAAATQARVIASFPPPRDPALTEEAYRKGQAGIVSALDIEQPLEQAARDQGLDPAALCTTLAGAADHAAAQLPQQ